MSSPETGSATSSQKERERSLLSPASSAGDRGVRALARLPSENELRRQWQRTVTGEYEFCHDKMAYNRTKGREAEVDGILTGKSLLDARLPLFPAKATHQQLLGLVHRPSFPDRPAPKVSRERKWLGDAMGWEGEWPESCWRWR